MKVKDIVNLLLEYNQESDVIFENEMEEVVAELQGIAEYYDEVWITLKCLIGEQK